MAFTKEQLEAINTEGSNIIVSAGAGSGKTAVLTERVIRKLKDGVSVDKLLILTFTNEAANEMKSRIREAIIKNGLNKQLGLIDSAYITTFDSFALSIVKKYHYLLNIGSDVSIIDSNIIMILKYEIIDNIFESMYGDNLFDKLINDFCLKNDKNLKEYIIDISLKLDLLLNKNEYLDTYIDKYYNDDFIEKIITDYNNYIKREINELNMIYEDFQSYCSDKLISKLDDWFRVLLNGNTYDDYVLFERMPAVRFMGVDETGLELKEELKNKIDLIKKLLRFESEEKIVESIISTKDYIKVIIDIIKKLDKEVFEYKNKYNVYEFNDIALMANDIVLKNTDIKDELKEYFNEIMIDEYQDTSNIQEEFISKIANDNVYMVGDIKQSIYRFRNANPYIFRDKYNKYSLMDGGRKIDLLKNFRSRSETLFNINEIFNLIMDNEIGDCDYLESHNMVYGNTLYDLEDTGENNFLEIYNYQMEEACEYTPSEKELFIIGEDINNKIKNGYKVFDKKTGKLRNIRYSDICIITDRNKYLDEYKKILEYLGIPSVLYKDEILTNDMDILVIKNLISLVDYVNKEIFDDKFRYLFTSVARSFLFKYDDNLIYKIHQDKLFYEDKIFKMCKNIDINRSIPEIINNILTEFSVYDKLTNLTDIDKSLVRISNLIDISMNLSMLGYDITKFIKYLDILIEKGIDVKYSVNTSSGDSVKIMNIHKSKGLEFSLCYFTGMHNKFTIKDMSEKFIVSDKYGIILPYKENELEDTILKELYKDDFIKAEVSEKIRLFYVALTRCREKMIILASLDLEKDKYDKLVPFTKRIKYRSFLDILNSIKCIDKYIVNKEGKYSHDYDKVRLKNIKNENSSVLIEKRKIQIVFLEEDKKHFSKSSKNILDNETIKIMEYGTMVHEMLEFEKFENSKNKYVNNLLSQIDNNYINIYKEYEFMYTLDNTKYHGIIDLMLEYDNYINIIDYKLKKIDDDLYIKQLNGYRDYIMKISNKKVNIYLYSIMDNILKKL